MAEVLQPVESPGVVLHTSPVIELDNEQFFRFCQLNPHRRIERTAQGDLVIRAPASGNSGFGNAELIYLFKSWEKNDRSGRIFDSSTGFNLPNGATRSPDLSWLRNERLATLTENDWNRFLPLCPDFVLELRSPSEPLRELKAKMEEYIASGASLGWLIDPIARQLHVYRPHQAAELIPNPGRVSAHPVLKNFHLDLPQLWAAMELKPRS